jgi:hypothetical protein
MDEESLCKVRTTVEKIADDIGLNKAIDDAVAAHAEHVKVVQGARMRKTVLRGSDLLSDDHLKTHSATALLSDISAERERSKENLIDIAEWRKREPPKVKRVM